MRGLRYLPDFLATAQHDELLEAVDAEPWRDDLKRRVQHHGFVYDYKSRRVDAAMRLGPLPAWGASLAERLVAEGLMEATPDQLIVNEYLPGQGISAHTDCVPCFGPTVVSLTLGSGCAMVLAGGERREEHYLAVGSALVLSDEARYGWTHAIPARRSDIVDGARRARGRRVSLTYRTVIVAT